MGVPATAIVLDLYAPLPIAIALQLDTWLCLHRSTRLGGEVFKLQCFTVLQMSSGNHFPLCNRWQEITDDLVFEKSNTIIASLMISAKAMFKGPCW